MREFEFTCGCIVNSLNTDFVPVQRGAVCLSLPCAILGLLQSLSNFILLETNECLTGTHNCDIATRTCKNTAGSFLCECRSGLFENVPTGTCSGEGGNDNRACE